MNRQEFVKEFSEKKALRYDAIAKSEGLEIKDYYLVERQYRKQIINYLVIIVWYFSFFLLGIAYGLIKSKSLI